MKRKIAILGVFILCASLFLTGGKPKLISEDEAKKAGLAFINHVFDVNETEATVEYGTHAAAAYVDGEYLETGEEQPVYFYVVKLVEDEYGAPLYLALVNAETGVVYYAEQSFSHVPKMNKKQREIWDKAYGKGEVDKFDYLSMDIDCKDFAREWIPQKFDLKAQILGTIDCGMMADSDGAHNCFFVVIRDGTIYYVDMAWPQMTILSVGILNETRPYMGVLL